MPHFNNWGGGGMKVLEFVKRKRKIFSKGFRRNVFLYIQVFVVKSVLYTYIY
jgi:hypothetical protein